MLIKFMVNCMFFFNYISIIEILIKKKIWKKDDKENIKIYYFFFIKKIIKSIIIK